jgi:hypothetical protein
MLRRLVRGRPSGPWAAQKSLRKPDLADPVVRGRPSGPWAAQKS